MGIFERLVDMSIIKELPEWLLEDEDYECEDEEINEQDNQVTQFNGYTVVAALPDFVVLRYADTEFGLGIKQNQDTSYTTFILAGMFNQELNQFYIEQRLYESYAVFLDKHESVLDYFATFIAGCLSINLFDLDAISEMFLGHLADGSTTVPNIDQSELN